MRIEINGQHLDDNDPPGFDAAAWIAALVDEYRDIAARHFPSANVDVTITRERASGYSRGVAVDCDDPEVSSADWRAFETAIEYAENAMWDASADLYFCRA